MQWVSGHDVRIFCFQFLDIFRHAETGFQNDTLKWRCDWLTLSQSLTHWQRVLSSQNHFENPSETHQSCTIHEPNRHKIFHGQHKYDSRSCSSSFCFTRACWCREQYFGDKFENRPVLSPTFLI